jgi:SNF2-related domain/Helicase conserved C-terminal domain
MQLTLRLAPEFTSSSRQKGLTYYQQGRVRLQECLPNKVEALVVGSGTYHVSLTWTDPSLLVECDCPYFFDVGPCKHLWATVLAAQGKGHLGDVAVANKIVVELSDSDDYDDGDEDPFELLPPLSSPKVTAPPEPPRWKRRLTAIASGRATPLFPASPWPSKRQIVYQIDPVRSFHSSGVVLAIGCRDRKADGEWGRVTPLKLRLDRLSELPETADRTVLSMALGAYGAGYGDVPESVLLRDPVAATIVHLAVETGRCYCSRNPPDRDSVPLIWDDGEPWRFELEMAREPHGGKWIAGGWLRRGDDRLALTDPLTIAGRLIFMKDRVFRLAQDAPMEWITTLRKDGALDAGPDEGEELLSALLTAPGLQNVSVPEELRYQEEAVEPRPRLHIKAPKIKDETNLEAELAFEYDGVAVDPNDHAAGLYRPGERRWIPRRKETEAAAVRQLEDLGFKAPNWSYQGLRLWHLRNVKLPRAVRELVESGWHIEAEGKLFRRPGDFHMEVVSGIDWFELQGGVEYGDSQAHLPELLAALRRGEDVVRLEDGTYGLVPREWLLRVGMLAQIGDAQNGHVRFRSNQAGLLDALLATQPEIRCDQIFARVREELKSFQSVKPAPQPDGFVGTLRDYQREGLGWMEFLRRFSFGGCLADDMGVGKTAQVLAMLEERRASHASERPSLVVAPRSLIFNWKMEAARFTPQLTILDYTGATRSGEDIAKHHVVLTTYGTLRRDAVRLKDVEFDYVVLDEAQAVKNGSTESAKAVRLLKSEHRLALSGTPIENHIGELFSMFEFLNPGMLDTATVFKAVGASTRVLEEDTRRLLAHALRPFILRRTKEQVARELPAKTEQTIYCEMKPDQRKLYNELREHYRATLLHRVDQNGLAKSKMHVLEALLRLRQAACHPGLIDKKRSGDPSAKLEVLLERLREIADEGHKTIVFSQFTSLLRIVRDRLDAAGIVYEYLDGATRNRQEKVERFQEDAQCPLFLVSLKAGGLGLNLTAAEYVFLLDPWWNPAVEAQAIDRAHRIGQTHQVFAYRLIARDTVEEKVVELQKTKRDLAAAIIEADGSVIRNLRREDLELLLS